MRIMSNYPAQEIKFSPHRVFIGVMCLIRLDIIVLVGVILLFCCYLHLLYLKYIGCTLSVPNTNKCIMPVESGLSLP